MNDYSDIVTNPLEKLGEPEELIVEPLLTEIFTLYYRKGADILSLHFQFKKIGEVKSREHFRAAIERAKLHCERMRYRFLYCQPYVTDLDITEQRMAL